VYYSRGNHKKYQQRKKTSGCPFCDPQEIEYRLVEQTEHAYVIPNQTAYEVWEHHKVLEHLMVIPKRHVNHLGELTDAELLDIMRLTAKYEAEGYSVYARGIASPRRSVQHQHTHLIKIDQKQPRISVYMRRPYVMVNL
jgi:diadenosine tetraphosphate (Ap4A) HIT family hydrolase